MHHSRNLLLGAALAASLLSLPSQAANAPVVIGYNLSSDSLSAHVAKQEGFFAKNGLDATLIAATPGPSLMAGLSAGSMHFVTSSPAALLTAVNGGIDLVVVMGNSRTTRANDPVGLVVRSDIAYSKPSDLIGKKVATSGFGGGLLMMLRQWLVMKGVDAEKIDFVEAGMPTMGDLLKSKTVDAVAVVQPFLSKIEADGFGKLVEKYNTDVLPNQPATFWATGGDWGRKNPALVAAFRASIKEATAFIAANPEKARAMELAVFKANQPRLPDFSDAITREDMEAQYRIGKELKFFDKEIDVSKLLLP